MSTVGTGTGFWKAALVAVGAQLMLAGCAAKSPAGESARVVTANGTTVIGTLPSGPEGRLMLQALPRGGVYRWVDASQHFTGVPQVKDSADAADTRANASLILRLHGWREAAPNEEPAYELAVGRYERVVQWLSRGPGERVQTQRNPQRCEQLPPAQRQLCLDPAVASTDLHRRTVETRFAFAVVRLADQATAWWIAPDQKGIPRLTLELIQRGTEGETAFGR